MATPTLRARTDRRDAILQAALRCFLDKGFEGTSMDDIRRASGASIGSIYHRFGGKDDLADTLFSEALADYHAGVHAIFERETDPEGCVKALVRHYLSWIAESPDKARLLFCLVESTLSPRSRPRVHELNRLLHRRVRSWLKRRAGDGSIRHVEADVFYALVIGPSEAFGRVWLSGRARTRPRDAAEAFAVAAWAALKQP